MLKQAHTTTTRLAVAPPHPRRRDSCRRLRRPNPSPNPNLYPNPIPNPNPNPDPNPNPNPNPNQAHTGFLVFQGYVAELASKSPAELTKLFEEVPASGDG